MNLRLARKLLTFIVVFGSLGFGQASVRYTVSLKSPDRHLVKITMEIPAGPASHELQLPVWNALYQVRDFSQYMNWIRAQDSSGRALQLTQSTQSRWQISGAENGARVEYEMFSDDAGPYGAQLNTHHAFFNLAEILLYAEDERQDPIQIEFRDLPARWKIATPLQTENAAYHAKNYDQLVDSPVELGMFEEADFTAKCGTYRVVLDPTSDSVKTSELLPKIVPSIQRIVAAATSWMGDCPFQTYTFIYHSAESGGGGMEHAFSTAITLPAKDFNNLDRFNGITAHEFFHLWNVKRIRPQSLEPIDYTKENFTPALWFSEGVDSTVGEYIQLRAGLLDERHFLDNLGQEITELENRPAHLTQSVEQSSLDAWLEKYPYYGLPERSISYYNKGELLGVLLDLAMRDASHDQSSLRDLFRWMNQHYAKQGKFFADSDAVRQAAETVSHADLREFFRKYVGGVEEIPGDSFFGAAGLHVVKLQAMFADPGFEAVQKFGQPPMVVQVRPQSEAERAGLKSGDALLQINGQPAGRLFETQIANLGPGATLHLVVRRDAAQYQLQWKLGSREQTIFQLRDLPSLTPQQKARRAAWLFDTESTAQ